MNETLITLIKIKTNKDENHEGAERMGQRDGLTNLDVEKLNKMYKC
jgi:hypothetical protein